MISEFRSGLMFWWRGWGYLLSNRHLLVYALLPILFAVLFAGGAMWLVFTQLSGWVHALIGAVGGVAGGFWYDFIYYPLAVGGGIVVFVATIYVSYVGQKLFAVPFYSLLAEKALVQLGKKPQTSWANAIRMFKSGLVKAVLMLAAGLILFVFSFVPLLNVLAIACALLILATDCMDYSFECMGMGLRQRMAYLWRERVQWAGMAAGLALTLPVPGLTLLVIPGAIVGSAMILKVRE